MDRPLNALLSDLRLPGHLQLAEHWLELYQNHGHRVPSLSTLDPIRFPKALADSWIVDAEDGDRFRIRLSGETLVSWYGFNPKGRYYEELFAPAILPVVTEQSRRVVADPAICYHRMHTTIPDWTVPAFFERLALPLADAEGRVRHLVGATLFLGEADHGKGGKAAVVDADYWYAVSAAI